MVLIFRTAFKTSLGSSTCSSILPINLEAESLPVEPGEEKSGRTSATEAVAESTKVSQIPYYFILLLSTKKGIWSLVRCSCKSLTMLTLIACKQLKTARAAGGANNWTHSLWPALSASVWPLHTYHKHFECLSEGFYICNIFFHESAMGGRHSDGTVV